MVVSNVGAEGTPSSRMVLCKSADARGFTFFTNYDSRKARELAANPQVSLLFPWHPLGRQIRVDGSAELVDRAESEADLARAVNARAPAILADEAKRCGALLVHYSTDYVFDGAKDGPYVETDATAPLNVYGETKLEGERAVAASGCAHLILRTSWVYAPRGRNFLLTMLRLAQARDEIGVVDDQRGAPTSSGELARATLEIFAPAAAHARPLRNDQLAQIRKQMGQRRNYLDLEVADMTDPDSLLALPIEKVAERKRRMGRGLPGEAMRGAPQRQRNHFSASHNVAMVHTPSSSSSGPMAPQLAPRSMLARSALFVAVSGSA